MKFSHLLTLLQLHHLRKEHLFILRKDLNSFQLHLQLKKDHKPQSTFSSLQLMKLNLLLKEMESSMLLDSMSQKMKDQTVILKMILQILKKKKNKNKKMRKNKSKKNQKLSLNQLLNLKLKSPQFNNQLKPHNQLNPKLLKLSHKQLNLKLKPLSKLKDKRLQLPQPLLSQLLNKKVKMMRILTRKKILKIQMMIQKMMMKIQVMMTKILKMMMMMRKNNSQHPKRNRINLTKISLNNNKINHNKTKITDPHNKTSKIIRIKIMENQTSNSTNINNIINIRATKDMEETTEETMEEISMEKEEITSSTETKTLTTKIKAVLIISTEGKTSKNIDYVCICKLSQKWIQIKYYTSLESCKFSQV